MVSEARELSEMAEPTTRLTTVQGVNIPCAFFDEKPIFPVSSDELKELPAAFVVAQSAFERAKKDKDNPFFNQLAEVRQRPRQWCGLLRVQRPRHV